MNEVNPMVANLGASTTLELLPENAKSWVGNQKIEIARTDRLAQLIFQTKMVKWIEPIVREFSEGEMIKVTSPMGKVLFEGREYERKEVIDRESKIIDDILELDEENNVEEYDFQDEMQDISEFIKGASSFVVLFKVTAFGASGQSHSSFSRSVVSLGEKSVIEVSQEALTLMLKE